MARIELGMKVKDRITGLTGIVIGRTEYLTGCAHVGVQQESLTPDGKVRELEWLDETRFEIIDPKPFSLEKPSKAKAKGGPASNPSGMK